MLPLVLASGSPYRKMLLERLGIPFETLSRPVDESALPHEAPMALATRLAQAKARAVATDRPRHLIIGSDQVATHRGQIIGKPGNLPAAREQLARFSGDRVSFLTGLCLFNSALSCHQAAVVATEVQFRQLHPSTIQRYLEIEKPWDCAGSFKAEGLGITLFTSVTSKDPTSLIGLPLIRLTDMLLAAGVTIP